MMDSAVVPIISATIKFNQANNEGFYLLFNTFSAVDKVKTQLASHLDPAQSKNPHYPRKNRTNSVANNNTHPTRRNPHRIQTSN
jgi:hypothetical protein